jgi:hypothetical protein
VVSTTAVDIESSSGWEEGMREQDCGVGQWSASMTALESGLQDDDGTGVRG